MRPKVGALTAVRCVTETIGQLPTGIPIQLKVGDWMIVRGQQLVDWAPADNLQDRYEVVREGQVTLTADLAKRAEATLGIGSTRDPFSLVAAIERLAAVSIGSVHVEFTPGQLEEIKHRALKRGHTVEQELRAAVDRVKDEIFHRG